MNHDFRVWQSHSLSFGTAGKKECSHAGSHTDTDRGYITFDVLHRIVDSKSCAYRTSRAVDIHVDIFSRIFRLQEQKLCNDQVCRYVGNFLSQKNNTVVQQS